MEDISQPKNLTFLRFSLTNCFDDIAKSVSKDEFIKTLTNVKLNHSMNQRLYEAMKKELRNGMRNEFESMLEDGSLESGLLKISKLSREANALPEKHLAWRPPGDVALHLRALDALKIREAIKELEGKVAAVEDENKRLMRDVQKKRESTLIVDKLMTHTLKETSVYVKLLTKLNKQYSEGLAVVEDD